MKAREQERLIAATKPSPDDDEATVLKKLKMLMKLMEEEERGNEPGRGGRPRVSPMTSDSDSDDDHVERRKP